MSLVDMTESEKEELLYAKYHERTDQQTSVNDDEDVPRHLGKYGYTTKVLQLLTVQTA